MKKHKILKGKRLTEYQKNLLYMLSDSSENNYILEVFETWDAKSTYELTNGEDDFEDVRESTMKKLRSFDFINSKLLPSSETVIRTKYFIPEKYRVDVYLACM